MGKNLLLHFHLERSVVLSIVLLVCFILAASGLSSQTCNVNGGTISTSSNTTTCSGDGTSDIVNINVSGNTGSNSRILLTDANSFIVEIHQSLSIDFEGRPSRTYIVRHVSYEGSVGGLSVGGNLSNLSGCYSLSTNSFTVTTFSFNGGVLTTQNGNSDTMVCVDDGRDDYLRLRRTNMDGFGAVWATTDLSGVITALDAEPGPNFEGSGSGTVRLYFIQSCQEVITGITVGMNISAIPPNTDASNPVTITKVTGCCHQQTMNCGNKKVLMCVNNVSTCVPQNRVNTFLQQGATLGGCWVCSGAVSRPVSTRIDESINEFTVYPNPANNEVFINIISQQQRKIYIDLVTHSGQLVRSWTEMTSPGLSRVMLRIGDYPGGMYLLRLRDDRGAVLYSKIVVKQ